MFGFRLWVCGESWLAVKDSLTHRPSSQGWAPRVLLPCCVVLLCIVWCVCVCFCVCPCHFGVWWWRWGFLSAFLYFFSGWYATYNNSMYMYPWLPHNRRRPRESGDCTTLHVEMRHTHSVLVHCTIATHTPCPTKGTCRDHKNAGLIGAKFPKWGGGHYVHRHLCKQLLSILRFRWLPSDNVCLSLCACVFSKPLRLVVCLCTAFSCT